MAGSAAQPSPREVAGMSGMATDLSKLRRPKVEHGDVLPLKERARAQRDAERQLDMRCAGCDARITTGFKFTQISVVVVQGDPGGTVATAMACNGDGGCDFAAKLRQSATCVEMVEFVWLDGGLKGEELLAEDEPARASGRRRSGRARRASAKRRAGG